MEPSNLIILLSDDEDNTPKTLLDKKSQRVTSNTVRNRAAFETPPKRLQSQNLLILAQSSPRQRLVRSKSAEVVPFQSDIYKSIERTMSAPCLMCTPRASIPATNIPVTKEAGPATVHHEPAGYMSVKQPLAQPRSHTPNENSASKTKISDRGSVEPRPAQASIPPQMAKPVFRHFHAASQPTKITTGTMILYPDDSHVIIHPPSLKTPPELISIPRPPCLNPTPRQPSVDPYLKYPYLAAAKAAAPRQYVSVYPQQEPRGRLPQHLIDHSMPAFQPLAPKRKADDSVESVPKRVRRGSISVKPSQPPSAARSKISESPAIIGEPSNPKTALSVPRPPRNRAWTSVMLVDFAETLRTSFDFDAFATKHGKAVKDIHDTFGMVVMKPIFEHSSRGMARARMQSFNQKLKEYVAWMKRGGRDVHGELTTSPSKKSDKGKAKEADIKAKEAKSAAKGKQVEKVTKAGPSKGKGSETPKRARAIKGPGEPLVYRDGIYQ